MFKLSLPRLAAGLLAAMACSAHASGLTLAQAQARVASQHPALQALHYELTAQDGVVQQAGVIPNPELSGLVEDRQSATRTTTVQLTQPVELGGKRGARIASAESERQLIRASLELKHAEVRAATAQAFHAVLAAQARLELSEAGLALAQQALAAAGTRVAAGKSSPVDETRARIALSGAELDRLQARADSDNARETLAALWGGSGTDLPAIAGQLDPAPDPGPLPALLTRLDQAPAITRARLELERRLALGRLEQARRMPDLAVTVGSKNDEQLGRRQAVFGVSVPLPLFDRNQGRVLESSQRTEQARGELAAARTALASELRMAHTRLSLARSQARALQADQLRDARSTVEATRKAYEHGKFNLLDVLDAQRVLLQAQAQHVRALADAHTAAADIERILGATQP